MVIAYINAHNAETTPNKCMEWIFAEILAANLQSVNLCCISANIFMHFFYFFLHMPENDIPKLLLSNDKIYHFHTVKYLDEIFYSFVNVLSFAYTKLHVRNVLICQ